MEFDCWWAKYEYSPTTFDSSLGYQDVEIVKGGNIETKIVHPSKRKFNQYSFTIYGLYSMDPSFKQVKYYGNQSYHELVWEILLMLHTPTVSRYFKKYI